MQLLTDGTVLFIQITCIKWSHLYSILYFCDKRETNSHTYMHFPSHSTLVHRMNDLLIPWNVKLQILVSFSYYFLFFSLGSMCVLRVCPLVRRLLRTLHTSCRWYGIWLSTPITWLDSATKAMFPLNVSEKAKRFEQYQVPTVLIVAYVLLLVQDWF